MAADSAVSQIERRQRERGSASVPHESTHQGSPDDARQGRREHARLAGASAAVVVAVYVICGMVGVDVPFPAVATLVGSGEGTAVRVSSAPAAPERGRAAGPHASRGHVRAARRGRSGHAGVRFAKAPGGRPAATSKPVGGDDDPASPPSGAPAPGLDPVPTSPPASPQPAPQAAAPTPPSPSPGPSLPTEPPAVTVPVSVPLPLPVPVPQVLPVTTPSLTPPTLLLP
jgi:hypothetical protein